MKTKHDEISKSFDEIKEYFNSSLTQTPSKWSVWGKTLKEWIDYFNVKIPEVEDPTEYRRLLAVASNKGEECADLISYLKISTSKNTLDASIISDAVRKYYKNKDSKVSIAQIEREIKESTSNVEGAIKMSEIYLAPLKEQQTKLRSKREVLKSLLMSVANQLNNFKTTNIDDYQ